ncbi:hypothetical protein ACJX0J_036381, partial [Zea mays]
CILYHLNLFVFCLTEADSIFSVITTEKYIRQKNFGSHLSILLFLQQVCVEGGKNIIISDFHIKIISQHFVITVNNKKYKSVKIIYKEYHIATIQYSISCSSILINTSHSELGLTTIAMET